jgi:hypothetical protein
MGFFDVAVSVLHWLAENAELERERRQRQPASESMLEGRRRALGGITDADRLLREYGNLMRDVLSTVAIVMLQNDRNKDAFRQALLLKSSTAPRSTASRQAQHDFSSHIWRASKLLLLPLQQLMLRIEPSPSSSTIVLIFDMMVSSGSEQDQLNLIRLTPASTSPLPFHTLQFDDYHLATLLKSGAFHTGISSVGDDCNDSTFDAHRFVRALESPPRIIRHADLLPFVFQLIPFCESSTQDLILRSLNHLVTGNNHRHEYPERRRILRSFSSHSHNVTGKRPSSSVPQAIPLSYALLI